MQRSCEASMYIQWLTNEKQIVLSSQALHGYDVLPKRVILNLGSWKNEMVIDYRSDFPADVIGLPAGLSPYFQIPNTLPYEMYLEERNLYLGPIIAFIPVGDRKRLTEERLNKLECYFTDYKSLKGLLYVGATNAIDPINGTIEGFYYDPEDEGKAPWKPGIFPYPNVLYRKTDFRNDIFQSLITTIGNKIFNTYFFDKWELWEWLSPYPSLKEHLPETRKLKNLEDLNLMLQAHPNVYLKLRNGSQGKGLIRVKKSIQGYHFIYRLEGEKVKSSSAEASQFIAELIKQKEYLIQEAIPIMQYEERNFDFRVIMQKNSSLQWTCPGIIARFGAKGNIATNFTKEGFALYGHQALEKVFKMSTKEAFIKEQELSEICLEVCQTLDKCGGHYGDLGIDVMIDSHQKVWILEVNKLHDHKMPLYALKDKQMYLKVVTNPFAYAKALAGFGRKEDTGKIP